MAEETKLELMTMPEVAAYLARRKRKITRQGVWHAIKDGRLKPVSKITIGKRVHNLVSKRDVDRIWFRNRST